MLPETLPALQRVLQASVMVPGLSSPGPGNCFRSAGGGGRHGDTGRPVCKRSYLTAWELFLLEW